MNTATLRNTVPARRPKLEPAKTVLLDQARARLMKAQGPSLKDLLSKLGGFDTPEVSGSSAKG
jgi:hypothetical protein